MKKMFEQFDQALYEGGEVLTELIYYNQNPLVVAIHPRFFSTDLLK